MNQLLVAAVKVKGTTVGTTTNLDGEFILKASKGRCAYHFLFGV